MSEIENEILTLDTPDEEYYNTRIRTMMRNATKVELDNFKKHNYSLYRVWTYILEGGIIRGNGRSRRDGKLSTKYKCVTCTCGVMVNLSHIHPHLKTRNHYEKRPLNPKDSNTHIYDVIKMGVLENDYQCFETIDFRR